MSDRGPKSRRAAVVATLTAALTLVLSVGVPAADAADTVLSARATAVNILNIERAAADRFDIRVAGWSSDDELASLVKALKRQGPSGLTEVLADREAKGWVAFDPRGGSGPGRDPRKATVRYAREIAGSQVRQIFLIIGEHVGYGDNPRTASGARLEPDMVSVVVLELTAGGDRRQQGTGRLYVGATVRIDAETGRVEVERSAADPILLRDVKVK